MLEDLLNMRHLYIVIGLYASVIVASKLEHAAVLR